MQSAELKVSLRDNSIKRRSWQTAFGLRPTRSLQAGACIGIVGFQNRDEFETFQKARSWAVLGVLPCFEASQNGSKAVLADGQKGVLILIGVAAVEIFR